MTLSPPPSAVPLVEKVHEDSSCRVDSNSPAIGLAFLALFWSQTAHAQVKLEYKFPESKTLKYKSDLQS